jgi:hypothetical protein
MAVLERSKLYQDVWSRPCMKIAAGLGISSSALKRICTEMDIPAPVAGYWTRVQCGKKVSKDLKSYIEAARDLYLKEHGQPPEENSPADLWFRWAEVRLRHLEPLGEGFRPWNGQAFRRVPGLFPES